MEGIKANSTFTLPKKKVFVKPIKRARGMVKDPKHIAYFMMPGSTIEFTVPRDRSGFIKPVLTEEEIQFMEDKKSSGLAFNPGDLSPYKKEDNFWESKQAIIKLGDRPIELDISNPMNYIKYKILLSNSDLIAPNEEEKFNKATYLYYITTEEEQVTNRVSKATKLKRAYKFAASMEDDAEKMRDFLIVYGKRPSSNTKKDFLISEIDNIIETDLDGFLSIVDDEYFEEKLLVLKAANLGVINKKGTKYYGKDGSALAYPNEIPTLTNAVKFLKSKENQELYLSILAQVESKLEK